MPRRCLVATAHARLPASLDDGLMGAHRRHLLHRAAGRVLDLSPMWEANLAGYHQSAVTSLVVTSRRSPARRDPALLAPEVVAGMAEAPRHAFDAVVLAFALCVTERPAELLAAAADRLAPGGELLVLQHVAGTGLTGVVQYLTDPFSWAARTGCRLDLDVPVVARAAGLDLVECARFRLWVAGVVPVPGLAGVLVARPEASRHGSRPEGARTRGPR